MLCKLALLVNIFPSVCTLIRQKVVINFWSRAHIFPVIEAYTSFSVLTTQGVHRVISHDLIDNQLGWCHHVIIVNGVSSLLQRWRWKLSRLQIIILVFLLHINNAARIVSRIHSVGRTLQKVWRRVCGHHTGLEISSRVFSSFYLFEPFCHYFEIFLLFFAHFVFFNSSHLSSNGCIIFSI